jgi:hypothetical protein
MWLITPYYIDVWNVNVDRNVACWRYERHISPCYICFNFLPGRYVTEIWISCTNNDLFSTYFVKTISFMSGISLNNFLETEGRNCLLSLWNLSWKWHRMCATYVSVWIYEHSNLIWWISTTGNTLSVLVSYIFSVTLSSLITNRWIFLQYRKILIYKADFYGCFELLWFN